MSEATRRSQSTTTNRDHTCLYLAFELDRRTWKLGTTIGLGQKPRRRTLRAGDLHAVEREIAAAKKRFGLKTDATVLSCYEAGRDGFWIHRYLQTIGVDNLVVDAASFEVSRRKRRAKTDRLDLEKMLRLLVRYQLGERKVFSVVRVPSVEAEDHRHLHRELEVLKRDRTRARNRIRGLLMTVGISRVKFTRGLRDRLGKLRQWNAQPLPPRLRQRLEREAERLEAVEQQIRELDKEREESLQQWDDEVAEKIRRLLSLRGVGMNSAWLLVMELYGWRGLRNRRQVGALAGLAPTPHQSGGSGREQGINKAGLVRVRTLAVELAWCWLRYQPGSDLSRWYQRRFAQGGRRMRRVGIVALARKLLIALWRWAEQETLPPGAVLKPSALQAA
jgi:transposase